MNPNIILNISKSVRRQSDLKELEFIFYANLKRNETIFELKKRINEINKSSNEDETDKEIVSELRKQINELESIEIPSISEGFAHYEKEKRMYYNQ